ncbi:hypothetical protein INP59_13030 [Rhodococcus pyridinivorans]|uniref:Uncharacterized protein n=1 Tax=Rhodococcus pyridinivorans TaxID=103816 RepID=A0A7M2XH14_9NOCA|nr:hypothetical protein [Rhodococcus pyridinivorans]QOV96929.1 hypothetical protein INP59_13030 [Rhodococcus pyridinivorans]
MHDPRSPRGVVGSREPRYRDLQHSRLVLGAAGGPESRDYPEGFEEIAGTVARILSVETETPVLAPPVVSVGSMSWGWMTNSAIRCPSITGPASPAAKWHEMYAWVGSLLGVRTRIDT